jgi:hypothetical protein
MTEQIFGVDLLDIIREDTEDFEEVSHVERGGKHDYTRHHCVYKHTETVTFWCLNYETSYNNGLEEESISFGGQVEPVEVITTKYRAVKNG